MAALYLLISYDIGNTEERAGQRRLRRVARLCEDHGQRVQFSVFEVCLSKTKWTKLRLDLLAAIDPEQDSLRFYYLGEATRREHHGTKPSRDFEGPLIF